jgi:hypothetical protein
MKQINFKNLNERNEFSLSNFLGVIQMEFIKTQKGYLIKDSNGRIVSEEEKLKLENEEMILQDFKSNNCQEETTKKISKNKKKITALQQKEKKADDTIQETNTIKK